MKSVFSDVNIVKIKIFCRDLHFLEYLYLLSCNGVSGDCFSSFHWLFKITCWSPHGRKLDSPGSSMRSNARFIDRRGKLWRESSQSTRGFVSTLSIIAGKYLVVSQVLVGCLRGINFHPPWAPAFLPVRLEPDSQNGWKSSPYPPAPSLPLWALAPAMDLKYSCPNFKKVICRCRNRFPLSYLFSL